MPSRHDRNVRDRLHALQNPGAPERGPYRQNAYRPTLSACRAKRASRSSMLNSGRSIR